MLLIGTFLSLLLVGAVSQTCPTAAPKNGDPCSLDASALCDYDTSEAKCVGGKWDVTSSCKSDTDCGFEEFCWSNICLFYQQPGGFCDGFTARPRTCLPGYPCIKNSSTIADLPGKCGCQTDSECAAGSFCWSEQCIPYSQVGGACGGFTAKPLRCAPGLTCVPDPKVDKIPDLPGKCAKPAKCPASPPTPSSPPCTGTLSCRYGKNVTCCNGLVQFNGKIYQCFNGQWVIAVADGCLMGCTDQCPADVPKVGDNCWVVTTKKCTYPKNTARCVKGVWQVQALPSYGSYGSYP